MGVGSALGEVGVGVVAGTEVGAGFRVISGWRLSLESWRNTSIPTPTASTEAARITIPAIFPPRATCIVAVYPGSQYGSPLMAYGWVVRGDKQLSTIVTAGRIGPRRVTRSRLRAASKVLENLGIVDLGGPLPVEPLRSNDSVAPLPVVAGGFATILADPPWRFQNRTGKVAPEHRRLDRYSTLDLDAICALPVADVAAANAHLYLWVPNALLPEGLRVLASWGFRYTSNLVWAKRRKDGGPDGRGVGFYFRNVTELLLFGVRGSLRTLPPARSQVNMIETRKREHSRKPDEQYALIEACSPGPYLELFARRSREGWTSWGDESAPETTPQGKSHLGYAGGPLMTAHQRSPKADPLFE